MYRIIVKTYYNKSRMTIGKMCSPVCIPSLIYIITIRLTNELVS